MLEKIKEFKIELLLALFGLFLGIGYFLIPLKLLILLAGAAVGSVLVFWKLEIGIFTAAFVLPFMPTMATIGLVLLIVISFIIRVILNKAKVKFGPLSPWILIFAGLNVLYALTSVDPVSSSKVALVVLSYLALYFVTINTIKDKNTLYFLLITLIASATLESLYGIYQYKVGVPTADENWTDPTLFPEMQTRVFGTLDNPNILAQYLEFVIPLTLGLFWTVKDYFKKAIFLGLAGIMILCLIFTFSRGGWVALALSVLVFGILKDRRMLIAGGLLGLVSVFFLPDVVIERFKSLGNLNDSSNSYRSFIWVLSLNMIKDFWYSGVGLGVEAFSKVYNALYIREGVSAQHSHNLYLQILAETGVFGMLSFLAVVINTFRQGLVSFVRTTDELSRTVIASFLGGMVAFLFHGVSENSFYNFKIVFMFWFVISIIMAVREMGETLTHDPSPTLGEGSIKGISFE